MPKVILSTDALKDALETFGTHAFVAVDTEFMRQSTYRPILCLIQLAVPGIEVIVDPLAPGLDLGPFYALMANPDVVKVFHAARQDIEIVYQDSGLIPKPLFDSQIAAMALGYGEAVSYGTLVKKLLKRNHDKTYQAVDWSVRPLTSRQLEYAIGDVTHLRDIYAILKKRLKETGREAWLEEEVALLTDPKTYAFDPADAWKRMKLGGKSKTAKAIIIELCAWREQTAQSENVPRARILKDDAIYEIAKHTPRSADALTRLRAVRDQVRSRGSDILAAVEAALNRDRADMKDTETNADLPASTAATIDLLRVLLKAVAADLNIAPKLLASSEDLEKLVLSDAANIPALTGWRRGLFGEKALALKEGRLALSIKDGEIQAVNVAH